MRKRKVSVSLGTNRKCTFKMAFMKSARALLLGVEDAGLERHRLPQEKYVDSDGRTQNSQLWEQIDT